MSDILASPYEGGSDELVWYGLSPSEEKIFQSEFGAAMLRGNLNRIKSRYKMSSSITSLNLVAANSSTFKHAPPSCVLLAMLVILSYLWL